MKSYIKIYGPPVLKAVKALEKIAINMPSVCIMDKDINLAFDPDFTQEFVRDYFLSRAVEGISQERCGTIISKSGLKLGDYDFFFEWIKNPTTDDLKNLIEKIEDALKPLGCKYTLTTK